MNRTGGTPLGICVFGQPALGKTRLAFETMRAELAGWIFVRWPHNTRPADVDFAIQPGKKLVLWLDNLYEYAGPSEAPLLDVLSLLEQDAERLVIVATCRDGEEQTRAEATLHSLLERLTPVQPALITQQQANALTADVERQGVKAQRDEFDGTPGSVLLGVKRMFERYVKLEHDAQRLLLALKLLRSAFIYDYPVPRVHNTAVDVFHQKNTHWFDAVEQAIKQGFLRREALAAGEDGRLIPIADVYLDVVVPAPTNNMADFWPELEKSLTRYKDIDGLISLGSAFNEHSQGNLLTNQLHAEVCYRTALKVYTQQSVPDIWAMLQNNLGMVLCDQAELTSGETHSQLLAQSIEAYRAALTVVTKLHLPFQWAKTQNNLAIALCYQAKIMDGEKKEEHLEQAVEAFRAALEVFTQQHWLTERAETQNNLGLALSALAEVSKETQAQLWMDAVAAYKAALGLFTQQHLPKKWAMTQNNLGLALASQAIQANGETKVLLLNEAVAAYREAMVVVTREAMPAEWASIYLNLSLLHLDIAVIAFEAGSEPAGYRFLNKAHGYARQASEVFKESDSAKYHSALAICHNIEEGLRKQGRIVGE